jgi:hypothetical protein
MVSNAASALGEAIGTLFETAIIRGLTPVVKARGHTIGPARLENGAGNVYQIDAGIFEPHNKPVVIIDPKYIRYTKHNRDNGSWLCVAHYNLRKTYPSIRKSIAILAGRWSEPSIGLIRSFGVETIEVPFQRLIQALAQFGIDFDWDERDRAGAREAWTLYNNLSAAQKETIAAEITAGIMEQLQADVETTLDTDLASLPRRVSSVEVLLKTSHNEVLLSEFDSVAAALRALTNLVADRPDISAFVSP